VTVTLWEPLDLSQYAATRRQAWDASGATVQSEQSVTLPDGRPALQFQIVGPDGAQAFFQFALIGERFVSVSGSGDFEQMTRIAQTLRALSE
jgi:hypothetical protein